MDRLAPLDAAGYRTIAFAPRKVDVERRSDGTLVLRSPIPLGEYDRSICDNLEKWAQQTPEHIFLAQRAPSGDWQKLTYGAAWTRATRIGQALLDRGLEPGDRIAILSGNSIEHALVALAGMAIGVIVAPISPNYTLLVAGLPRLQEIARVLQPRLVFVQRLPPFVAGRTIPELASATWVSAEPDESTVALADLEAATPGRSFADAFRAVGPDTIAKILFTSGSTGSPKGVINTQQMLCANVAMTPLLMPPTQEPPVQVEWLPWHHTMGGNSVLHSILKAGGTLYIDPGRPTREGFDKTIAALKDVSPTAMLNVPAGYALLVEAMSADEALRRSFFKRLTRVHSAGAALDKSVLDRFQALAVATVGSRIPFISAYGTTETAPGISMTHWASETSGELGLPFPGIALKLVPRDDRYEVRIKGPTVTPGYLGRPDLTAAAFDDEGFYCIGDAVSFVDPDEPTMGLRFAGRFAENFKLANGTWVMANDIRLAVLRAAAPALHDVVIAGENRETLTLLCWPSLEGARAFLDDPKAASDPARLAADPGLRGHIRQALARHNADAGSSCRIAAFAVLEEPPSLKAGEITDKGNINQRAALANRAAIVDDLYRQPARPGITRL